MQLTKTDVISMIGIIKANYNYAYKNVTIEDLKMMQDTWFACLKKYQKEIVNHAFQKSLESCKVPPTIADIVEQVNLMVEATEPTVNELWAVYNDALKQAYRLSNQLGYNARIDDSGLTQGEVARIKLNELFDGLPKVIKGYCVRLEELRETSKLNTDELQFEKSKFFNRIPFLKNQIRIRESISPEISNMIEIKKTLTIGDSE